jgi:choline monooxygenase
VSGGFEPDLSIAETPPSAAYFDPEVFRRERERIFSRTWQLVGPAASAAAPGDYFACEVAGEPVVVARDEDGVLRALSNVCRHRAGPVARGAGRAAALRCGYHGWTYGLDGTLRATPEWDGVRNFDRAAHCLPEFRVAEWRGMLFVNLDANAAPLEAALSVIAEESRKLPIESMRPFRTMDYEIACNWKVYVDNYLEGYHIPIVHPELFRRLDYRAYRVETSEGYSKQHAPYRETPGAAPDEALYYWLFPNVMLNLYPDNLQSNAVLPLSPERTLTRFEWYALDPDRPGAAEELERSVAFADRIQQEDVAICEAVQKGLRSRTYDRGRYSVRRENGVHHFHGLLHRFLAA